METVHESSLTLLPNSMGWQLHALVFEEIS